MIVGRHSERHVVVSTRGMTSRPLLVDPQLGWQLRGERVTVIAVIGSSCGFLIRF